MFTYDTFQKVNNIGAGQTAQAGLRLCCSQTPEDRFSHVEAQIISNFPTTCTIGPDKDSLCT